MQFLVFVVCVITQQYKHILGLRTNHNREIPQPQISHLELMIIMISYLNSFLIQKCCECISQHEAQFVLRENDFSSSSLSVFVASIYSVTM